MATSSPHLIDCDVHVEIGDREAFLAHVDEGQRDWFRAHGHALGLPGYTWAHPSSWYRQELSLDVRGEPVSTPVNFAAEGGKLYAVTGKKTGKFKRIRNNPKVQVAPCTMRGKLTGPTIQAVARILPPEEWAHAENVIKPSRGLLMRIGALFVRLSNARGEPVYLEIVPAKEK